jgi:hypothetical protein
MLYPSGEGTKEDAIAAAEALLNKLKDEDAKKNADKIGKLQKWLDAMKDPRAQAFQTAEITLIERRKALQEAENLKQKLRKSQQEVMMDVLRSLIIPKGVLEKGVVPPPRGPQEPGSSTELGLDFEVEDSPPFNNRPEGLSCSSASFLQEPLIDRCECYSGRRLVSCQNWRNCDVYRRSCTDYCVSRGFIGICKNGLCP